MVTRTRLNVTFVRTLPVLFLLIFIKCSYLFRVACCIILRRRYALIFMLHICPSDAVFIHATRQACLYPEGIHSSKFFIFIVFCSVAEELLISVLWWSCVCVCVCVCMCMFALFWLLRIFLTAFVSCFNIACYSKYVWNKRQSNCPLHPSSSGLTLFERIIQ